MALSARSIAPAPGATDDAQEWPWHTPLVGSVRVSLLKVAQRRMEAETYLTDGYGIRLALEAKHGGWVRFSEIARASAPPRIKQVLVSPKHGVPYLNTSQVFDVHPKTRKWLAMAKTLKAEERLVKEGAILVMASATVGRAIVATKAHENAIVSHHFMRVRPNDTKLAGWVYAYLRSSQAKAMMTGAQYASVIRHIEPHHLATLPVPQVSDAVAKAFETRVTEIVRCRNTATAKMEAAQAAFAEAVGPVTLQDSEVGFAVPLRTVLSGRRRLEGAYHSPRVRAIMCAFKKWEPLGSITGDVWQGNRFRRHYGENGIPYLSADDVFTTNPHALRRILVKPGDGHEKYFVERGWIVMARSGQIYGMNGSAMITTEWHENTFFSDDLIHIKPKADVRVGYLLTALTHPTLGRPLLIREAYGTSIPHLDPPDVAAFPVVRFDKATEDRVADLAEAAAEAQAKAEVLERELSDAASKVILEFLMRPSAQLSEDAIDVKIARDRLAEIEAHPERVVRGAALHEKMKQWLT